MKSVIIIRELVKLNKAAPLLYVPCFIFDGIMILKVVQSGRREQRKKARTTEESRPAAGPSTQTVDVPVDASRECRVPCRSARILTLHQPILPLSRRTPLHPS
ncbi:hypothetical protein CY34DRAFT_742365 [Suillus luteus UH-Slu-Lm8-n1]|uniref:Uncharacterized protein n=1 Tax=Suillus luteus UH-Slu-Lm8-n1 TaxID=930992 RepID=A0A0D0A450_9AGAM|nr:hypothetical protein CY34DRAFT_742365 [Suillus luteus UH-Slu-Lm8-n1]